MQDAEFDIRFDGRDAPMPAPPIADVQAALERLDSITAQVTVPLRPGTWIVPVDGVGMLSIDVAPNTEATLDARVGRDANHRLMLQAVDVKIEPGVVWTNPSAAVGLGSIFGAAMNGLAHVRLDGLSVDATDGAIVPRGKVLLPRNLVTWLLGSAATSSEWPLMIPRGTLPVVDVDLLRNVATALAPATGAPVVLPDPLPSIRALGAMSLPAQLELVATGRPKNLLGDSDERGHLDVRGTIDLGDDASVSVKTDVTGRAGPVRTRAKVEATARGVPGGVVAKLHALGRIAVDPPAPRGG